ncbi:hypothetical protein Tco_1126128 [Tanacetum coccineum]
MDLPNTLYPSRRYGVSMPALTKDHKGKKINTPYPEDQYAILEIYSQNDNPNFTMEEYIRLEEEKSRRHGKCITGKLLSMVRSGAMKTFTTSDLLKLNSQL